jgi:hypothetical protein
LGTTLDLGANPRAASDRRATGVLDEGDLRTYRTLLAQSDDLSDGGPEIEHLAQTKWRRALEGGPSELASEICEGKFRLF